MQYSRLPFFLRPGEEAVRGWLDSLGLPRDVERGVAMKKAFGGPPVLERLDSLMKQAGIGPNYWGSQFADSMDSHRLAWYAASESLEKGELMWKALSRRYFEGKDTEIRPIRLDSHAMLLECAREAGLDMDEAAKVLQGVAYRDDILEVVEAMHAAGVHSIPVVIFEVDGIAQGSWMDNQKCKGRKIHHGSGNKEEFKALLWELHQASSPL